MMMGKRKILAIMLMCCYINLAAQEHLSKTGSFSVGYILNPLTKGRGLNLGGHYHLNGYDEFRLCGYAKREYIVKVDGGIPGYDYSIKMETYLLAFEFARGLKLKSNTNIYLGAGLTGGYEQVNDGKENLETGERLLQGGYSGLWGFRVFAEFETALAQKFSLLSRAGQQFLFSGSGVSRYEFVMGMRIYM